MNDNGLGNNQATLFYDSAPCNLTEPVKCTFREMGCNREKIKKRGTNMYQPFDVCIFAPIKQKLRGKWSNWYLFDDKNYTVHYNMR